MFGRVLRTGLSSLRDRARSGLAALRFNPSRIVPTWAHEFEPVEINSHVEDQYGNVLGRVTRRGRICWHCGNTDIFSAWPCKRDGR